MSVSSNTSNLVSDPERFLQALKRFDEENAKDPNIELANDKRWPRELLYARRLYAWVERLDPNPPEVLLLAARSQHICRWLIPRRNYEMTRAGYIEWRNELKAFHARRAAEILRKVGYPEDVIEAVEALNLKKDFPRKAESRTLEDALCLVFLQYQFDYLAKRTSDAKMIRVLRKSWNKMTPAGRRTALKLPYSENELRLLKLALELP